MTVHTKKFMQGNEACAEGAFYAGCRFFAGYPITPSTEVMEIAAARLPKLGGVFIQIEDEIVGHMREAITIPAPGEIEVIDRLRPTCSPAEYKPYDTSHGDVAPLAAYGEGYRFHVTGLYHGADGFPTNNTKLIEETGLRLL